MVKVIWSFSIFETMVTIENTQECSRRRRAAGGLERAAYPQSLSAEAPRAATGDRQRAVGHQFLQDRPESPRQRLQHRLPDEYSD